jgi:hypothetical protein
MKHLKIYEFLDSPEIEEFNLGNLTNTEEFVDFNSKFLKWVNNLKKRIRVFNLQRDENSYYWIIDWPKESSKITVSIDTVKFLSIGFGPLCLIQGHSFTIFIRHKDDDWYYVYIETGNRKFSKINKIFYRCDNLEGVESLMRKIEIL